MAPVVKISTTNAFVTDTESNSDGFDEQFPPFRKVRCSFKIDFLLQDEF